MKLHTLTVGTAAILSAAPSIACSMDGPLVPKLPYETVAQHQFRQDRLNQSDDVLQDYQSQMAAITGSQHAWLGRVVSVGPSDTYPSDPLFPATAQRATIRPLLAFKGELPAESMQIEANFSGGMCFPEGDGEGALAKPGELVFVFTGFKEPWWNHPNAIQSFKASSLVVRELQETLRKYLNDDGE